MSGRSEEVYEGDHDEVLSDAGRGDTFYDVLERRLTRRGLVAGAAAVAAVAITGPRLAEPAAANRVGALGFAAIDLSDSDDVTVADGYLAVPLLKWGDPIMAAAPAFDPTNQTAAAQEMQFGYNCDWIGFLPLPVGSTTADRGLLVVNHEYTNPELMFENYLVPNPAYVEGGEEPEFLVQTSQEIVDVELAAHGMSVVEIARDAAGVWAPVVDSTYNRRLTATTPMTLTGPAAGSPWTMTSADATGTQVAGTLNNCAGGLTPWGTAISGEENFQQYFAHLGQLDPESPIAINHARYGLNEEASERLWETVYDRFDLTKEPNEPFRFGWAIEFDPYDPTSAPKKRTALGRNKHEGHTSFVAPGGQVVIYSGDDERFDYAYKFVTTGTFNPDDRAANLDLLDEGTLYVARFNDDGTGEWLPLVFGQGDLTEANGFTSQADVLVNTRLAADLLGATKMDRPEDFETNPVTGKVYLVCTNNSRRKLEDTDAANPRVENVHGHIIEIAEGGAADHAATTFTWEIFLLAGDPKAGSTYYAGFPTANVSAFSAPDNIEFDLDGNLWISTDGNKLGGNDGLYVVPTEGEERGKVQRFFNVVKGAECSGPEFNTDDTALFVSIQHPGEGGTWASPVSMWPDSATPARPSVVVITAADGVARIGRPRA
jgi:secreted PhoX family phosphatase